MSTHTDIQIPYFAAEPESASVPFPPFAISSSAAIYLKRWLDLVAALLLAPLVLLLIAPICLLVMLDGGKPIYRHLRIGRGGRIFHCYKIRSMTPDAEARLKTLLETNDPAREEWEGQFKLKDDPRITRLGRFLRRTSLDELPQLWNVMRGEMSFIGPRPIVPDELEKYGEFAPAYLACLPGISGLWQVNGRNDTTYEARVAFDTRYAREWSLLLDVRIVLKTLPVVLKARGSY